MDKAKIKDLLTRYLCWQRILSESLGLYSSGVDLIPGQTASVCHKWVQNNEQVRKKNDVNIEINSYTTGNYFCHIAKKSRQFQRTQLAYFFFMRGRSLAQTPSLVNTELVIFLNHILFPF